MSRRTIADFRAQRAADNERVLETENLNIKRFFRLDAAAYEDTSAEGGLDRPAKELLGLAVSTAFRCNDCIDYHLEQCVAAGCSEKQIEEALNVALIIGGSIIIPHLRHARRSLDELLAEQSPAGQS
jgi:AhpD family alkylhydroperoxidase